MSTRAEIAQALEAYQAGRLGRIPATEVLHHRRGDIDVDDTHDREGDSRGWTL
ncbi:MAG: hypothetical protein M0Z63_11115 [Actinomycetota bacterium]|jgi:hypothetical protein|nr:hypothetical protein [Actinomycetota bacterium]MDA8280948.1 hypothetical protein [Actinomycetota bacterium]